MWKAWSLTHIGLLEVHISATYRTTSIRVEYSLCAMMTLRLCCLHTWHMWSHPCVHWPVQSMWADRERKNFRSPLKPVFVTPDPRSVPRSATSRSCSSQFFHTRSPDFWPAPLQLRYAPICFKQQTEKVDRFYGTSRYASAVLAVVILCLSVGLSVCHTRALWQNQTMHFGYFDTTRKGTHPDTKSGWWATPLRLKFVLKVTQPFKTRRIRQSDFCL